MTTSCCTSCIDARLRCRVPASKQCGRNAQTRLRTSRPWLSQTCDAPREASIPHPASGAQLFSGNRLARALAGFCALRACARVDAWRQAPRMSARQQGQRAGLVASPHAAYSWRPGWGFRPSAARSSMTPPPPSVHAGHGGLSINQIQKSSTVPSPATGVSERVCFSDCTRVVNICTVHFVGGIRSDANYYSPTADRVEKFGASTKICRGFRGQQTFLDPGHDFVADESMLRF